MSKGIIYYVINYRTSHVDGRSVDRFMSKGISFVGWVWIRSFARSLFRSVVRSFTRPLARSLLFDCRLFSFVSPLSTSSSSCGFPPASTNWGFFFLRLWSRPDQRFAFVANFTSKRQRVDLKTCLGSGWLNLHPTSLPLVGLNVAWAEIATRPCQLLNWAMDASCYSNRHTHHSPSLRCAPRH